MGHLVRRRDSRRRQDDRQSPHQRAVRHGAGGRSFSDAPPQNRPAEQTQEACGQSFFGSKLGAHHEVIARATVGGSGRSRTG
eukprot:7000830-Heterocapsa_arctica.AAC.1